MLESSDKKTLIGQLLQYVFGNYEVAVFIVGIIVMATLIFIISDLFYERRR